jgi:hypothetical protein
MPDREESVSRAPALFELGARVVTADDVLVAAHVRGALDPLWRGFLAGVAAEEEGRRRGLDADSADVEARSDAFRYERGLLSAAQTEAWLAERDLSLDDLEAFCRRMHREAGRSEGAPEPEAPWREAPADLRELFRRHLVLSGDLDRLADDLARRMAVFEDLPQSGRPTDELDRLLAMEAAFEAHRASLPTPRARERVLEARRILLTRVEVDTLATGTLDAAREAVLCVREDGTDLAALAAEIGCPLTRSRVFLQDLDEDLYDAMVSAAPGDFLPPIRSGTGFLLHRLVAKREPDASDPEVLRRVDEEIVDAHERELTARRVRRPSPDSGVA